MIKNILELIFPDKCIYCKKLGEPICKSCLEKINIKHLFKKVNNDYFDYLFCGSFYKKLIKTQIHSFKFHRKAYLYRYFIELCLRIEEVKDFLKKFDIITYVPMHYKKELERGYNQSKLLAEELGRKLNLEVICCLEKTKENKTQSSLSEKEREDNVKDVFVLKEKENIKDKNVILVDDILTTGSTARAASKLLKESGAKKICIFAIAKT